MLEAVLIMATIIRCKNPACRKQLAIKEELLGRKVMCPHCRTPIATAPVNVTPVRPPAAIPVEPPVPVMKARGAREPVRERDDRPRGLIPLLLIATLALYLVLLTPFFTLAALTAFGLGTVVTVLSVLMVLRLMKERAEVGMALPQQISLAQREPRTFASWVVLEGVGIALLVVSLPFSLKAALTSSPSTAPQTAKSAGPKTSSPAKQDEKTSKSKKGDAPSVPEKKFEGDGLPGVWEGKSNNHGLNEVWTIGKDKEWSVVCKYFVGEEEAGSFHGEKFEVRGGELVFQSVYDKAPLPGWASCEWKLRRIDADQFDAHWRDRSGFTGGGRYTRKQ